MLKFRTLGNFELNNLISFFFFLKKMVQRSEYKKKKKKCMHFRSHSNNLTEPL